MTTIAHRVNDEMQRRCNEDKTMGTAQPAGRIQRRQHHIVGRIGVGNEGRQGGGRWEGELGENCIHYSWWS